MNILVTGGFGYIGSRLVPALIASGHEVEVAGRRLPDYCSDAASRDMFVEWDIRHPWSGKSQRKHDLVIHLASANDIDSASADTALEVNALGTRNVLEFCRSAGVPRFLYLSTFQVYGKWEGAVDELDIPRPTNDYALTHWFAEEYARMYCRTGGPCCVILRPTNIYGTPAYRELDRWTLVPNCFCLEAFETGSISLRSSGLQWRDFISTTSLAERVTAIAERFDEHAGQTYVVASGRSTTVLDIARLVAERYFQIVGRRCMVKTLSDYPQPSPRLNVSGKRATAAGLIATPSPSMADEIDSTFALLERD